MLKGKGWNSPKMYQNWELIILGIHVSEYSYLMMSRPDLLDPCKLPKLPPSLDVTKVAT